MSGRLLFDNLVDAIIGLHERGYTEDFNLDHECLFCVQHKLRLFPDEFEIDSFYRFDNETDPSQESIMYAISSIHYALKGVLINAYGNNSDSMSNELVAKLSIRYS